MNEYTSEYKGSKIDEYLEKVKDRVSHAPVADEDELITSAGVERGLRTKYAKPDGGIPKTDLASDVQTSLGKADTALQAADITGKADKTYVDAQLQLKANVDDTLGVITDTEFNEIFN